ncbi:hypothetical protein H8356DRAFT_1338848 [Neocallimastix lanati (nom. inval.)]|nr:hypothetical protein H8356DRAFT_1338848 [Neocallimastix sp. JGI-2020a]
MTLEEFKKICLRIVNKVTTEILKEENNGMEDNNKNHGLHIQMDNLKEYTKRSFIILNDKKEILKHESLHNHLKIEFDISISIMKHKYKEEIRKSSAPFDIKLKKDLETISSSNYIK